MRRDESLDREALLARARLAVDRTPLSVAAAEGVDHRRLRALLAGDGEPEEALRLARAFAQQGAELRSLAQELVAAASQD